jgi:hypothetical protein
VLIRGKFHFSSWLRSDGFVFLRGFMAFQNGCSLVVGHGRLA